jgi:diaminohydroxyphosphoribosylaminopyrimidine deaminase / 5-amino-6-(5-phosphoribosylamino)uracil reductase
MTHPNPLVGAVLVRDGEVVGEGFHATYGGPHAEIAALQAAGAAARGATLYVSLEPCAHHGKTPPCVDAIIAAGVTRVVYAAVDPDPQAAGGAARLRAAGIDVMGGVESQAARALDRPFFVTRERGGMYCALKLAVSLDGGIAAGEGQRTQLTGASAVTEAHRLRADHDGVVVGIRTALVDDPLLTVRGVPCRNAPARIVLDSQARLPPSSRLLKTVADAPVWVVCGDAAATGRVRILESAGARVLTAPATGEGLRPAGVLAALAAAGLRSVLVEGGGRVIGSFLDAGVADRLHLFIAPRLLGADAAPGLRVARETDRWALAAVERFDDDVVLTLDPAEAPAELR